MRTVELYTYGPYRLAVSRNLPAWLVRRYRWTLRRDGQLVAAGHGANPADCRHLARRRAARHRATLDGRPVA